MAVIGKLREHSGIIIGTIALSIVGFLVMDATNSQSGVLRGQKTDVGVIDGEKIAYNDFMKKYEENQKTVEEQMRGQGALTDEQRNSIRQQTWEDLVNTTLANNTYSKAGVVVTDDEMVELTIGQNAHPYIRQSFTNPQTGQFDPQFVKMFLQNVDVDDNNSEPGTKRKQWNALEKEIKKTQLTQKYTILVSKGLGTPSWLAQQTYQDFNRSANVKFVSLPYTEINEVDIKYTDADLKNYLSSHEELFKQKEETRKILYAEFPIVASSADSSAELKELTDRLEEFKKGAKSGDDSIFVKMYSESGFDNSYYKKEELANSTKADSFFTYPVKTVIGPYTESGLFVFAKIVNRKLLSDSVRVREITFSFDNVRSQEEANQKRKLFDSIFTEIDSFEKDFGALAAAFSDDAQSKAKGGDKGWIRFGQYDKPYNDAVFFFGSKGETIKTMTQNALHIVQILEDRPTTPAVQLAYFTKSILPSAETEKNIYAAATHFAADNATEAKFKESAKKNPNVKTIDAVKKQDFSLFGISNARDLVRWAYNAKQGDVSGIISADQKHIVAFLGAVRSEGTPDLDAVKDQVKFAFIKDKKVELLTKKIEDAKAANIDALAAKLGKLVEVGENLSANNPMLGAGGYEPAVALAATYAPLNKLTAPIEGSAGVFVLQKTSEVVPPKATDLTQYKGQIRQRAQAKATRGITEALKEIATVEDNRFDFF